MRIKQIKTSPIRSYPDFPITIFIHGSDRLKTQTVRSPGRSIPISRHKNRFDANQSSPDTACPNIILIIDIQTGERIYRQRMAIARKMHNRSYGLIFVIIYIDTTSVRRQPKFAIFLTHILHDIMSQSLRGFQMFLQSPLSIITKNTFIIDSHPYSLECIYIHGGDIPFWDKRHTFHISGV